MKKYIFSFAFIVLIVISLSSYSKQANSEARDILRLFPEANILMWEEKIYITDVEWLENIDLEQGEKIGKVTKQTKRARNFKNGTSTHLPVGTEIYRAEGRDSFIIVIEGESKKKYVNLLDG
ncbi:MULTISPECIES: hypothetical protein [Bacillus]|uniref:hypothetical protein n=1 Tax=Bacillus TaxID=1386 RepID=UPI000BB96B97|nr:MULTISPECIES: hypothetical protein [Bacillus]